MTIQGFFMGFGIDDEQRKLLAICQEQIEAVNRVRRHALKIRNYGTVQQCNADLLALRQTADDLRTALAMPQASFGCPPRTMSGLEAHSANGDDVGSLQGQACGTLHPVGTGAASSKQNFPSHEGQGGNQQTNNV